MRHLPTTGGGPMMNALLGGHAETTASTTVLVSPHVKAGKLRLLAHTGNEPLAAFPEVPSFKSLGYDVEYAAWAGLVAPRGTPPHVIKILREAMGQAVKAPEVVNAHARLDSPVAYMDADEFNQYWAKDAAKLADVIRKIGKVESAK
ncbi:MAG TPA: tripartite tricarboxylate transporter substrate-binding protein [Methylomirabilota bacterium]